MNYFDASRQITASFLTKYTLSFTDFFELSLVFYRARSVAGFSLVHDNDRALKNRFDKLLNKAL